MSRYAGKIRIGVIAIFCAAAFAIATGMTILTAGIAAAQSVALSGNHPKVAAGLTSRAAPDRALTIQVSFALRNRAELDKFLSDLQDPASPRYHQGLTPKQFDARFGRTRDEIEAVEAWLSREGFQILHASADEITCRGTVATAESAFAIAITSSADGSVYANAADPQIPAQLVGVIGAIVGLDNTLHSQPAGIRPPGALHPAPLSPAKSARRRLFRSMGMAGHPSHGGQSNQRRS